jgi:hypothetical protein
MSSLSLLRQLKSLDFSNIQLKIIWVNDKGEISDELNEFVQLQKIDLLQLSMPDEEWHLKDLLQYHQSEYLNFFIPSLDYPQDYFQNTLYKAEDNDDTPSVRKGSFNERVMRAAQQSKYGLGVLKRDIRRNYSEFDSSKIYLSSAFKSGNILELSVSEELASEVKKWAEKSNPESISYHPNYKKIEYYRNLDEYIDGIRKEAPYLKFREKEDASGLPLYLLLLVWLSLILAFVFPVGILVFLVILAVYALTISLESLAISTIKRQGEIFIGLLIFFPFLHHLYLFNYFSGLVLGKKPD